MTIFLRLFACLDKADALRLAVANYKSACSNALIYEKDALVFRSLPGTPFPYWASTAALHANEKYQHFEPSYGSVRVGAQTNDDFRFARCRWEINLSRTYWKPYLKGDSASSYYDEISMVINWGSEAKELKAYLTISLDGGHWSKRIFNMEYFFRPGLSWALRTAKFSPSCVPAGCIPSGGRYLAISEKYDSMTLLGLWNSNVVDALCKLRMERHGHPKFIVGVAKTLPVPALTPEDQDLLATKASEAWALQRKHFSFDEISSSFLLPRLLLERGEEGLSAISDLLRNVQRDIDSAGSRIFGFDVEEFQQIASEMESQDDIELEDAEDSSVIDDQPQISMEKPEALWSWAIGVAFGRFDWRLATGEREAPPEPEPFDPLPAKSPGMLPEGDPPFHAHGGILVDDPGHPHDLPRIAELVLERVDMPVPGDLRRWVQKDFFPFHLQRYSKSRRKAPIYWPLATVSGSYALWLYYPSLTSQTLYTAVNDFVEPKLKQMTDEASLLRAQGSGRSHADEKRLEALESLETELRDLRDQMLTIAPRYQPDHDDGVQITAAPLWPLFRHKPWQKVLKDTWANLEKGDYDWAHLAMAYWPDRVREKCKTDKSLAIAHGLEELHVESVARPRKAAGEAPV